jgi:hypothetical protein
MPAKLAKCTQSQKAEREGKSLSYQGAQTGWQRRRIGRPIRVIVRSYSPEGLNLWGYSPEL